jgi:hypothetical protein
MPSCWQVEAGSAVHWFLGSVPALMGLQVPLVPVLWAEAQDWQSPVQGESQQKLSAQLPDWHSVPVVHARPLARVGWQVLSEVRQ